MPAIFRFACLLLLLLVGCHSDEQQIIVTGNTARPQPPQAVAENLYVVKPNDTLYSIGVAHHQNYQVLAQLNGIAPPYTIAVGQKIKLPTAEKSEPVYSTLVAPPVPTKSLIYSANLTEAEFAKQQTQLSTEPKLPEPPAETAPITPVAPVETEVEPQIEPPAFTLYEVKPNETLYSLSRRFGLTPEQLAASNNIASPQQLHAGQKLKIFKPKQKHSPLKSAENVAEKDENPRDLSQKTSIISIDNENMLKLTHQLPASGKLLKTFRATGNRGIEIGGKLGQAVRAVAAGKVVAIQPAVYGYGVFIVIQHANGYLSSYANNKQALVKVGQYVHRGQRIAQMGKVGPNPPSVEFEMRKNGQLFDPLPFLSQQK